METDPEELKFGIQVLLILSVTMVVAMGLGLLFMRRGEKKKENQDGG